MKLTDWQREFRRSFEFERIAERLKSELRDSEYRFTTRPEYAHIGHNVEESWGEHYCCHTCSVLGVRY